MTAVSAAGPIPFTDPDSGRQYVIPLARLKFDATKKAEDWLPYKKGTAKLQSAVDAWLDYLAGAGLIRASEAKEAVMQLTAADAGANGNTITIVISNVRESGGNVVFDAQVSDVDEYKGLDNSTLVARLTASPGLVTASAVDPANFPEPGTYTLTGDPASITIKKQGDATKDAFTLNARKAGPGGAKTKATITDAGSGKFDLKLTWDHSVATGLTPAQFQSNTTFQHMIAVTAPPGQQLGVPADGTYVLTGGADSGPAKSASATLVSR